MPKTNWRENKRLRKEDRLQEEAIDYQLVATNSDDQGWLEDGVDWAAAKNWMEDWKPLKINMNEMDNEMSNENSLV